MLARQADRVAIIGIERAFDNTKTRMSLIIGITEK
jgi:hypothetical protein